MARVSLEFQTIRSEGGLLPADLLRRVLDPEEKLPGTRSQDYGLPQGERLNEVITQSWNRLRKHWVEFRAATANFPDTDAATGVTNDKWSLPLLRELGFGLLPTSAGPDIGGRVYAISRFFGPVPIHLVGRGVSLDRRAAGVRGAAAANPHGLVQEFLNRSPGHTWAIVSNGLLFRVLRDNQALSRQSYLEFDLEAIFAGEVYSDFVLLWLMAHATRFAPRDGDGPESCWLEQWTKLADEQGTRALGDLRGGVEKALQILGEGFTSHPRNTGLRDALRSGKLSLSDFHAQLLRVVYRLIFLFVSEDRTLDGVSLLHPRDDSASGRVARERFGAHYSTNRLRQLAGTIKGSRHGDLWQQLQLLTRALSGDEEGSAARKHLALPALGSFLWNLTSTAALSEAELSNYELLEALRHLAFTRNSKTLRPVDYRNLGAEELGGVYESLLALTPQLSSDGSRFTFAEFAGNERKTSGAYYTPDSLVQRLLDSALDPVVHETIKGKTDADAEKAILGLKVCDPAVGSGHFLVGGAHRLARHLARVRALRQDESEPSPLLYQHSLRDVIGRCIYGVDVNPMAAELCRVSLWLEALEPGKPLSFLDHHIRVGNSLIGSAPELIAHGLPDEAFTAIEGDDKKACAVLKKRNKAERSGLGPLFAEQEAETQLRLQQAAAALNELPDDRPEEIRTKEIAFRRHEQTEEYRHKKQLADTWCAAFVIRKHFLEPGRESSASGITQRHLNDLAGARPLPDGLSSEVDRLSHRYQFFHWHLAFPEVFANGGFDCVLGNPPWEKINLKDEEFFAQTHPEIATAANKAERKRLIERLEKEDPNAHGLYRAAKDLHDHLSAFFRFSGRFPLTGISRINLYSVFCETGVSLLARQARLGMVLASGIVTDDNNKALFESLITHQRLIHAWDFENSKGLFAGVHRSFKFLLLCIGGSENQHKQSDLAFYLTDVADISDTERHFVLTRDDLRLLNPTTGTAPAFRSQKEAELAKRIYRNASASAIHEVRPEWPGVPKTPFNMANDSPLFVDWTIAHSATDVAYLPLYESKFIHQFNHRFATFSDDGGGDVVELSLAELADPGRRIQSRYWLDVRTLNERFPGRWFLVWRDITGAPNERTTVATVIPRYPCAHTLSLLESLSASNAASLCAIMNSFVYDYCARQKVTGTHLNHAIWKQLPLPKLSVLLTPSAWCGGSESLRDWLLPRVLELIYTSWDMEPFARECGLSRAPFRWDDGRRFLLRCELDAASFHLYLPAKPNGDWREAETEGSEDLGRLKASFQRPRDAVAYVMDTFPIVRRKDEENYGDYRTKLQILAIYDQMQQTIASTGTYQTLLDPPC